MGRASYTSDKDMNEVQRSGERAMLISFLFINANVLIDTFIVFVRYREGSRVPLLCELSERNEVRYTSGYFGTQGRES
jgi:hypothetical protein